MIHNFENYNFENKLYDSLNLEYNQKLKVQNNLLNAVKFSDYTYILIVFLL